MPVFESGGGSPIVGNSTTALAAKAILTRPSSYDEEVARGLRTDITTWNKFGYNNDIDSAASEVIASFGGSYVPPTTARTLSIVSTSSEDSSTGTGIQRVVITGIDANRESQVELVTLNGLTPVVTTTTWLGINRVAPFICGSNQANVGTITLSHTTTSQVLAEMPIGGSVTQQAIFHVQAGHTFLAYWLLVNVRKLAGGTAPRVTIKGWVFSPVANANIEIFELKVDTAVENTILITPKEPFPITEQSVLYFTATTNTNDTTVAIRFSGKEVKNA